MHHYVSKYIELSQQDASEISGTFWHTLRAHQKMKFQISGKGQDQVRAPT